MLLKIIKKKKKPTPFPSAYELAFSADLQAVSPKGIAIYGIYQPETYLRKPWRCAGKEESGEEFCPCSFKQLLAPFLIDACFNLLLAAPRREKKGSLFCEHG